MTAHLPPVHRQILGTRRLLWPDEAACAAWARALAGRLELADACIELHGTLGAGKTTFVRHLLRELGVAGRIKSPTYTVMEPYRVGALEISHFDFYRFNDPREFEDAGFRDVFARPGLKLVEWPDRAAGVLPLPDLRLELQVDAHEQREVTAQALTPRGAALLAGM